MAADPVAVIAELFVSDGAADYLGEPVSQASHMLQAAALAERAGAAAPLTAAALLHDVGHLAGLYSAGYLRGTVTGHDLMRGTDTRHSDQGARWLAQWFGPEVTEPVRLHVAAKRYLCAVEPAYDNMLSQASRYSLSVQGGPMRAEEIAAFEAEPFGLDACALRRFDDEAKDPGAQPPPFEHFWGLLHSLVR